MKLSRRCRTSTASPTFWVPSSTASSITWMNFSSLRSISLLIMQWIPFSLMSSIRSISWPWISYRFQKPQAPSLSTMQSLLNSWKIAMWRDTLIKLHSSRPLISSHLNKKTCKHKATCLSDSQTTLLNLSGALEAAYMVCLPVWWRLAPSHWQNIMRNWCLCFSWFTEMTSTTIVRTPSSLSLSAQSTWSTRCSALPKTGKFWTLISTSTIQNTSNTIRSTMKISVEIPLLMARRHNRSNSYNSEISRSQLNTSNTRSINLTPSKSSIRRCLTWLR